MIPPAWVSVSICPHKNGHLQATGRDAKGRKQYRYHRRWREVRDESKYSRLVGFGKSLIRIRKQVATDIAAPGIPRQKVLASVVQLLEMALIRVGNERYMRENGSFGLTTLRNRHAKVTGSEVTFEFKGKSGKQHSIVVNDPKLARVIRRCKDLPGYELFRYQDETGEYRSVDSSDVNTYLHEITGEGYTTKDFRTWGGTVYAATKLKALGAAASESEATRNVVAAVAEAARALGNTPAICRSCYIHPEVLNAYLDGTLDQHIPEHNGVHARRSGLNSIEKAVLKLLEQRVSM